MYSLMKKTLTIINLTALVFGLVACEKPQPGPEGRDSIPSGGDIAMHQTLVLNEGPQGNNASLSHIDLANGTMENNWFFNHNGRRLGDVAQDLLVYGSKAYVTVWGSGNLEAIDTATGSATMVSLGNRGPRYMAAEGGKLYISCYNPASIIRIDTATLQVEATCPLGNYNPEGIAIAAGRLFAVSSWIGESQNSITYDSTLYVIDLGTFAVDTLLTVGANPQTVKAIDEGRLIVNCWGVWNMNNGNTEGEGSAIVDAATLTIAQTGQPFTRMCIANGNIYGYMQTYDASWNMTTTYLKMDAATMTTTEVLQGCGVNNPYCIAVHPATGDIFIGTDGNYAANGDLHCFAPDGTRRWKHEVGMLPSKIVFY